MIAESNLLIYAQSGRYPQLYLWIAANRPDVSAITKLEILGYRSITPAQKAEYEVILRTLTIHPIDDAVIDKAIEIRQRKRMIVADALIAATALVNGMPLATANETDYANIPGLHVVNPMRP